MSISTLWPASIPSSLMGIDRWNRDHPLFLNRRSKHEIEEAKRRIKIWVSGFVEGRLELLLQCRLERRLEGNNEDGDDGESDGDIASDFSEQMREPRGVVHEETMRVDCRGIDGIWISLRLGTTERTSEEGDSEKVY
ncbi:unnamed protein product [Linum trigynum]|uniref:Uncharacterized protein n=1 Tax=Linum trigynum TaxID=586398 RepID=A0AAV2EHP4_9ROSI